MEDEIIAQGGSAAALILHYRRKLAEMEFNCAGAHQHNFRIVQVDLQRLYEQCDCGEPRVTPHSEGDEMADLWTNEYVSGLVGRLKESDERLAESARKLEEAERENDRLRDEKNVARARLESHKPG
jgi:hypothetical protein